MKRLIVALALAVLLIPTAQVVARDTTRNPVIVAEEGWQVQQTTEPKKPVTTGGDVFQIPKNNPSQTPRGFYPIPELGEPIP